MTWWQIMTEPQFSTVFVLITCIVFAWLGYSMKDDDPPGGMGV